MIPLIQFNKETRALRDRVNKDLLKQQTNNIEQATSSSSMKQSIKPSQVNNTTCINNHAELTLAPGSWVCFSPSQLVAKTRVHWFRLLEQLLCRLALPGYNVLG